MIGDGPFRRRNKSGPLLSVIVPVYDVEDYLDECLLSIRRQRYRHLEIVIVDDGSPDNSHEIALRHQRKDRRIRIVRRPNGGLSAARNTGVEAATGAFLTFVDSDDTVTAGGFAAAMDSLVDTDSDLAVLAYERLREGKPSKAAAWIRKLHATERKGVTLDELPDVMVNATAWAKVFRRDFWDRVGLRFVEGVIYEDQAFTAQAYSAARSFDVLTTTGYSWRLNESSMSQGHVTVENLRARLDAADDSLAVLEEFHKAHAERALQLVRFNLPNSLLKLERADDDYLDLLIARVPRIVGAVPDGRFASDVPAQFRVLYALLAHGDRDRIWDFVRAEGMQAEMHPSGAEAAGFTVYLPGWGRDPVPADAYVLTADQTQLRAKIVGGHRCGEREFGLDVQAWFQNVGLESSLTAVVLADGVVLDVEVARNGSDAVVGSRQGAERRYPGSGWTVTVSHEARSLPKTLDVALSLTAGPFAGSKRFAKFRSSRIKSL
jgi:glycosyltransferase involved in cell wall biosynthesis